MPPPLVAHVIYRLEVGGLENGLANLVAQIPSERYRHAVISLTDYTEFRERLPADVPVVSINKAPGNDLSMFPRLWRAFRELNPDIVHTRNLAALEAQVPAWLAGVGARVHGEHGWDVFDPDGSNRKYQMLRRAVSPLVQRFIPLSGHLERYLRQRVGIPERKIRQIYNGVDTVRFHPRGLDDVAARLHEQWGEDAIVIGTVGRLEAVKDQVTLAKAFVRLREMSDVARARARLAIVGNGSLRDAVVDVLKAGGALDATWLPGSRNDVPEVMRGLDIFALPSRAEGVSNTILEAMASGLPVVATSVGGNPELIDERSGALVAPEDPEGLAAALKRYVESSDMRQDQGRAGRAIVEERFSMQSMVDGYMRVYDEVLSTSHRNDSRRAA
ncbi:MAG: TIGR03088 family PEP-CTERM/XrtA system glycosyltransferase [Gammaproteobacteria bacterium]|nr:TIGR03088 family PEP-CTERM/XrtA system glycosyltransferase [Gammaproteobacteria bacterium]